MYGWTILKGCENCKDLLYNSRYPKSYEKVNFIFPFKKKKTKKFLVNKINQHTIFFLQKPCDFEFLITPEDAKKH